MPEVSIWLVTYVIAVNLIGFAAMGLDKFKAKNHAWRIPESTLFFIAIIGGSIGSIAGMRLFHHKTLHKKFTVGMPLILLVQIALILILIFDPEVIIKFL
ncbi:MAG: DUF1294 domain-containing protein [Lachnospiraceae bacterium]|nr:DUF1294 domain-containing protein [Lachnospiraceae bacterium]